MTSDMPTGNRPVKLTSTSVTDIVNGADTRLINSLMITEIAGGTPALSVEIYDGTNSFYIMRLKPMTARQTLVWGNIPLDIGQKLRVTAGAANQVDVFATVSERG